MICEPHRIFAWQIIQPTIREKSGDTIPGKLELVEIPVPVPRQEEVLVEVAGCAVSRSDLGCLYKGTPTPPRLPFGHELSGTVVDGDPAWIGKEVVVIPVLPCGTCRHCANGHSDRCLNPRTLRNSRGTYGGFASHIPVPESHLCEIKHCKGIPLDHLAVVSDTVATAYKAAGQASIEEADKVVVIGAGESGAYIVQLAKILGASMVIVADGGESRLDQMLNYGADAAINTAGKSPDEVFTEAMRFRRASGLPNSGWKVFEATASAFGRRAASAFRNCADKLIAVSPAPTDAENEADNLEELDAEIIYRGGCLPETYPRVLEMVTSGKLAVSPFILTRPMSWIREVFDELFKKPGGTQYILTPDDFGLDTYPEPKSCR